MDTRSDENFAKQFLSSVFLNPQNFFLVLSRWFRQGPHPVQLDTIHTHFDQIVRARYDFHIQNDVIYLFAESNVFSIPIGWLEHKDQKGLRKLVKHCSGCFQEAKRDAHSNNYYYGRFCDPLWVEEHISKVHLISSIISFLLAFVQVDHKRYDMQLALRLALIRIVLQKEEYKNSFQEFLEHLKSDDFLNSPYFFLSETAQNVYRRRNSNGLCSPRSPPNLIPLSNCS